MKHFLWVKGNINAERTFMIQFENIIGVQITPAKDLQDEQQRTLRPETGYFLALVSQSGMLNCVKFEKHADAEVAMLDLVFLVEAYTNLSAPFRWQRVVLSEQGVTAITAGFEDLCSEFGF